MDEEKVILVDTDDRPLGLMPKMEAHRRGLLHRAFSVFVFNSRGQLLLQQRAAGKYHSPGLWTNTVCSHQRQGESSVEAGRRRLHEEMGFTTELREIFSFVYRAEFDNGLIEHELDHVLIGRYDGTPEPAPDEVGGYRWVYLSDLLEDLQKRPENYTAWFRIIFEKSFEKLLNEAGRMFAGNPVIFTPYFERKPWGGDRLDRVLHKAVPGPQTGESWEVSAVPGKASRVASGIFKGFDPGRLWQWLDADYWAGWKNGHAEFPLLVKYIDTSQKISVQVHPGDAMARRLHDSYGKNEAWRIIDAAPDAVLYLGFKEGTTVAEYQSALRRGNVEKLLRSVPVAPGDMFYIPAGTVHAIGGGILLAEVQQSSDITYRIYDWNRPGLDGRPRPLHTDLALEAIRWDARPQKITGGRLKTPYFQWAEMSLEQAADFSLSSPEIWQNIGSESISINNHPLEAGKTALLWPGAYKILPGEMPTEVLRISLPENHAASSSR